MITPYLQPGLQPTPTAVLDFGLLPDIRDNILELASFDTLTRLAATSKGLRERVFAHHLPIQQVVLHREKAQFFGIDKNGKAVPLERSIVSSNSSGICVLQVFWQWAKGAPPQPDGSTLLGLLRQLDPPILRIMPTGRMDMIVTGQWAEHSRRGFIVDVTATFPMATYSSPVFHDYGHCTAVFKELPKDSELGRMTIIMVPHPGNRYCLEPHVLYESVIIKNLGQWLVAQPSFDFLLVFVGIELWLRFRYPNKSGTKRRGKWLRQVADYLSGVGASEGALNVVNKASFLTLEEYKKDAGDTRFFLQTTFNPPLCDFGDGRPPYDPARDPTLQPRPQSQSMPSTLPPSWI